jgi:cytochrome bd-type quinol oxidase subunit 2
LNSENLNKWITLLANIGVLVGLVFLAVEVRQSNRIAIAATEMSVRDKFISLNENVLSNDSVAALLAKATDANAEFSDLEDQKLYAYLYAFINTWISIEMAYTNGVVPQKTFDIVEEDIRNMLSDYPALGRFMGTAVGAFPSVADSHVYMAMKQALEEIDH